MNDARPPATLPASPSRGAELLRSALAVLGVGWSLACLDLLLEWWLRPGALDGFDLVLPYLWTGAAVLMIGAALLRLALIPLLRRETSVRRNLVLAALLPALALSLVSARLLGLLGVPTSLQDLVELVALGILAACASVVAGALALRLPTQRAGRGTTRLVLGVAWGLQVVLLLAVLPEGDRVSAAAAILILGLAGTVLLALRAPAARVFSGLLLLGVAPVASYLTASSPAGPPPAAPASRAPSPAPVILITVDTLRADHLRLYDPSGEPTPAIERLALEGIVFHDAQSPAPWTLPGLASILTGVSPQVHGATRPGGVFPPEIPTLGELLGKGGYGTAALGKNPNLVHQKALEGDFHSYRAFPRTVALSLGAKTLRHLTPGWPRVDVETPDLTRLAAEYVAGHRDEPFFLWLHYFDPHSPYVPPRRLFPDGEAPPGLEAGLRSANEIREGYRVLDAREREWVQGLYRGEVRWVDENLARLWRALERHGLWEPALIVLTSDHGEEFWEHDEFFHGHTLHRELLHVPLIVKLPGGQVRRQVRQRVSVESIAPTLLELTGVAARAGRFTAPSLAPLWSDPESAPPYPPTLVTGVVYHENETGLLTDELKYIRKDVSGTEELYDLSRDPGELRSLLPVLEGAARPEGLELARSTLERLRQESLVLRRRYGLPEEIAPQDLDQATREQLRALGYLD